MSRAQQASDSFESSSYAIWGQPVDQYGEPVERTKREYPYSYSPFVTWRRPGASGPGEIVKYSDRLYQWDADKYCRLSRKHFGNEGQNFDARPASAIEAFLRDYFDEQTLELELIMEGCNLANGFPVWTFHYRIPSK